jgi:anti-sigma factor ChrR (cupin superfamily)
MSQTMSEQITLEDIAAIDELVAHSIEPVAPPPAVRTKLMEMIRNVPQNSVTVRADEGRWKAVCATGVEMKRLSRDARRGTVTFLLRFQPGATLDEHEHHGAEESFVVEGSCCIGSVYLATGDYHRVEAGEHHGTVVSETGCVLLLTVDETDYQAA